jgi:hypothetical protein
MKFCNRSLDLLNTHVNICHNNLVCKYYLWLVVSHEQNIGAAGQSDSNLGTLFSTMFRPLFNYNVHINMGVRVPIWAGNLSLHNRVQTGSGVHPTSYPTIQWVPGALSLGVNLPGREADDSSPSSAEVKECVEIYLLSSIRFHGVVLS